MITVSENTTLVGVSEMRTRMDDILEASRTGKVIIEKRHKPYAVLIDAARYARMEERLDILEDMALARLAIERERGAKPSDYVDIETALKGLGKK
ncbi:MAG: type II toxin-antitoxin system prevent-host-death family antitoxin [Candidatus Omnitrophota bacterium]